MQIMQWEGTLRGGERGKGKGEGIGKWGMGRDSLPPPGSRFPFPSLFPFPLSLLSPHSWVMASLRLLALLVVSSSLHAQSWTLGPFEKPREVNPVLTPTRGTSFQSPMNDSVVRWEEYATFNPAAVVRLSA